MSANKEPEKTKARPNLAKMLGGSAFQSLLVPILAIFTGLVIGGIVIAVTDAEVAAAFKNFSADPGGAFKAIWTAVATAYGALFYGSLGKPA